MGGEGSGVEQIGGFPRIPQRRAPTKYVTWFGTLVPDGRGLYTPGLGAAPCGEPICKRLPELTGGWWGARSIYQF